MIDGFNINAITGLLQILVVVIGLPALYYGIKSDIRVIKHDVINLSQRQTTLGEAFTQLGSVLTKVAVQDERINGITDDIRELRHGKGWIQSEVGGEYPRRDK